MIDRIRAARKAATGVRGKYAGHLKKQCPRSGTDAAIFWQAAMSEVNAWKCSIYQMVFLNEDQREFFEACRKYVQELHSAERNVLDLDAYQLRSMGVMR